MSFFVNRNKVVSIVKSCIYYVLSIKHFTLNAFPLNMQHYKVVFFHISVY